MIQPVTFKLEAITALFLHGADQQNTAELRAAPFKGAARYWFRAAMGSAVPLLHDDEVGKGGQCTCLRCLEAEVFGSTEVGKTIAFEVRNPKLSATRSPLLPHHPKEGKGLNKPSPSPAVEPGGEFELRMLPVRPTLDLARMEAAVAAFWLAVRLGGFGQRSRRGAGSLAVQAAHNTGVDLPWQPAKSLEELAQDLTAGIRAARAAIHRLASAQARDSKSHHLPEFPQLSTNNNHCRIQVVELKAENEKQARAEVMKLLQKYKDPIFGLPHMKPAQGQAAIRGRHASPLWIHIERLAGRKFVAVQTVMRSATLQGSWKKIEEYFAAKAGHAREVRIEQAVANPQSHSS